MFCNSTITDLFLFVFTQLILHYLKLSILSLMKMVQSLQLILVNLVKKQQPHNIGCCFFSEYDFPKAEFEGYCRVGLIYTLH